jgi:hypothetical protein
MSLQQAWALRLFSTPSRDLAEIGTSVSIHLSGEVRRRVEAQS